MVLKVLVVLALVVACRDVEVFGPEDLNCLTYSLEADTVGVITVNEDTLGVYEEFDCIEARSIADPSKIWHRDPETGEWKRGPLPLP